MTASFASPQQASAQQMLEYQSRLLADEKRAVVALAAEGRLAAGVLHEWGLGKEALGRSVQSGLLVEEGSLRPTRLSRSIALETAYAVNASVRQMVLRRAQADGTLLPALALAKQTLKEKSRGEIIRRLHEGRLVPREEKRGGRDKEMESQVMASILQPFDATWLVRCWGERVPTVAEHVLGLGLRSMEDCGSLYHWLSEQSEFTLSSPLASQLAVHALHRLEPAVAQRHWGALDISLRLGFEAVASFQAGNVELARKLVEQSLGFSDKGRPRLHAWSPLLAFLQILSSDVAKTASAPNWFSARNADADHKDAARGLSRLIQELNPGDKVPRRLSAHQVSKEVTAWELLFLGLAVDYSEKQPGPRAAWSVRLCTTGSSWLARGYLWMGRQALVLAARLDREQVKLAGLLSDGLGPRPGDLASLLAPREPWEDALLALSRVNAEVNEAASEYRLEWFVNPHTGSVHQPALQSFHKGQGWSTLRRIDFAEARELSSRLATEDQRVVAVVGEAKEFPHAEVLEALIAHPRVVDGTQGGIPLDVVRGECQLRTREEGDEITVEITPRDLGPGLNILFDGVTKLSVVTVPSVMHQVMQTLPRDLRVPKSQVGRLREVLAPLAASISVKSALFGVGAPVSANSTPCLRVLPSAGAFLVEAGVRPFGPRGRFFVVGHGPLLISATQDGQRLRTERDLVQERRRMAELMSACPLLCVDHDPEAPGRATGESELSWTFDRAGLVQLLAEVRDSSLACEWEWPVSSPQALKGTLHSKSLRGVLRPQKGWYLLSGEVALDEVTYVSLAELSRMPKLARGRFVQLPSGDFLEVEKRLRRVLSGLSACSKVRGAPDQLKISHAALAALRALQDAPGFAFAEEAREALRVLDEVTSAPLVPPFAFRAELRDYQLSGYSWLHRMGALGFGACLADDMGLGKTIQVLALLASRPPGGHHLIVAPTSVCTNWVREIARFAPTLSAVEYLGAGRAERLSKGFEGNGTIQTQVVIVSYGLLHEDIEHLGQKVWDTVVLDEAQYIKNPHSLRAQAAFLLKGHQRIALSGTPIENHLGDLWSLFHFLNPELLGSWRNFETHFAKPIQRDKDSLRQETLREIVRPFLLRRTKSQVLKELPPLSTIRREITLEKEDALRYALLRKQIHNKLYSSAVKRHSKLEVLAEITRLRRFCCHPQLVFPEAPQQSAKVEALIELVEELRQNGHRALVFSQYVDFLHLIMNRLAEQQISYLSFDGSTPKAMRQDVIDRFQAGEGSLFLISLKAGGLGINLTAADYVIHLDPWWNPAVASQATDRAHRIGQERPVTVYEFVTRDTIEEDILVLHTQKRGLADALLEGGEQVAQLNSDELKEWFQHSIGSERAGPLV